MTVTKEVYVDLSEKFNKVLKLLDGSKFDPPSEPYASKNSASHILNDMKDILENLSRSQIEAPKEQLRITAMLGAVYMHLGMISIDTEELTTGEGYLQKCHDTIKDYMDTPEIIAVTLNMYNQFGIFWSQRDPQKSKSYLEEAQKLYQDYKKSDILPIDINELFLVSEDEKNGEAKKNVEKIYTFTLYYLAQIYGALKDTLKSALYCHITLQRQLDCDDYDSIDWALNAATLSQFFMEKNGFKQARHHLAASSYVLSKYEQTLNAITERNEDFDAKMEVFKHRSADVARCWAKYGLLLLSKSKERLLNETDYVDEECVLTSDLEILNLESTDEIQNWEFTSLNLCRIERQIIDTYVLTIQDARLVFLNIQMWLRKAELYYTLDVLASDHIEIVQDQSQMYLNLLFFEDNMENQAKLHKRRVDLLENIISKVSPQYYLQYCRQIWFELAQTYSDILNIKCDKLREQDSRPSPHVLTKINHLTERSIYNFTCFIESFKEGNHKQFPKKIHEDFEKAFLQAYFHIGALNSRYVTLDKKSQLNNTEASYEAYKKVVDYCDLNDKAKELIPMECSICTEMVSLLPIKIAKLRQELE